MPLEVAHANPQTGSVHGSAVLVHGMWGNPEDWCWVRRLLEAGGYT